MKKIIAILVSILILASSMASVLCVSAEVAADSFTADFSNAADWIGDTTPYINTTDKYFGAVDKFDGTTDGYKNTKVGIAASNTVSLGTAFDGAFSLYTYGLHSSLRDSGCEDITYYATIGDFVVNIHGFQTGISVTYGGVDIGGTVTAKGDTTWKNIVPYNTRDYSYSLHFEKGNIKIESELLVFESDFADFAAVDNAQLKLNVNETWQIKSGYFKSFSLAASKTDFNADFTSASAWTGDTDYVNTELNWFGTKKGYNGDDTGTENPKVTVTSNGFVSLGNAFDGAFSLYTNGLNSGENYTGNNRKTYYVTIGDFVIDIYDFQSDISVSHNGTDIGGTVIQKGEKVWNPTLDYTYNLHFEKGYILIESNELIYVSDFADFGNMDGAKISLSVNESWEIRDGYFTAFSLSGDKKATVAGDVSGDGKKQSSDLVLIVKNLLGIESIERIYADVNRDGLVDLRDLVKIKRIFAEEGINDNETSFTADFTTTEGWSGLTELINTNEVYFGSKGSGFGGKFDNPMGAITSTSAYNLGSAFNASFELYHYYENGSVTDDVMYVDIADFRIEVSAMQNQIRLLHNGVAIASAANDPYNYDTDNRTYRYEVYVAKGAISINQYYGDTLLLSLASDYSDFGLMSNAEISLGVMEDWQLSGAYFKSLSVSAAKANATEFAADFTTTEGWTGDRVDSINTAENYFGSARGFNTADDITITGKTGEYESLKGSIYSASSYDLGSSFSGNATLTSYGINNSAQNTDNFGMDIHIASFIIKLDAFQNRIALYDGATLIGEVKNETYIYDEITYDYEFSFDNGVITVTQYNGESKLLELTAEYAFASVINAKIGFDITERWQQKDSYLSSFCIKKSDEHSVIAQSALNGSISFDKASANAGDTVLVIVSPADGYFLVPGSLKLGYQNGINTIAEDISSIVSDNSYSFVMPEFDVTVSAEFSTLGEAEALMLAAAPNNADTAKSNGITLSARAYYAADATEYGFLAASQTNDEITHQTEGVQVLKASDLNRVTADCSDYSVNLNTVGWTDSYTVRPFVKIGNGYNYSSQKNVSLNSAAGLTSDDYVTASTVATDTDGRKIILHNNEPYMFSGVQAQSVRQLKVNPDTAVEYDMYLKPFFEDAAALSYDTLLLSIGWCQFERNYDVYEYDLLKNLYRYAEEFDINIQLLWFGSDVCAHSDFVPDYVKNNTDMYSLCKDGAHLDYSDNDLVYREKKAFSELLRAVYLYDTNKRTVAIQLENEPNTADDFENLNQSNAQSVSELTWVCGQYAAVTNLINELAVLCKTGAYRCVTRVNYVLYNCYRSDGVSSGEMEQFLNSTAVDAVGVSVYGGDANSGFDYEFTFDSNPSHVAESSGGAANATAKMLYAAANTNGLMHYELCFIKGYSSEDKCVLNEDGSWRDGSEGGNITTEVVGVNKLFKSMGSIIVGTSYANRLSFNDAMVADYSERISVGTSSVLVSSQNGGSGIAVSAEDALYIYSTRDTVFTFDSAVNASVGYYDASGNWQEIASYNSITVDFSLSYAQNGYVLRIAN